MELWFQFALFKRKCVGNEGEGGKEKEKNTVWQELGKRSTSERIEKEVRIPMIKAKGNDIAPEDRHLTFITPKTSPSVTQCCPCLHHLHHIFLVKVGGADGGTVLEFCSFNIC
jgi:hypothetical protein